MKRYWLANSSDTPPSPPSSTVGGYPQDGNIALNHKPTKVGAWWYHMITEEFMAVIERAGLTPSHENLHQLADIFDDFKQRAQGAETFKDQAVAAANRAEAAAGQVVTDVAGAIAQVEAATDAEIARLNTRAGEVEASTSTGLANLQNKLTELIANLEQVGGEQAAYVISQAQEILDSIIPPQAGNAGKVLGTDGAEASWVYPPSGRNLHEWVWSSLPLTDAGLHLADGAFISFGGVYDKWARDVERIKNAGLCPDSFVTQAEFDASVSAYGSCGKFVVSSDGVRLPKVSDILQGTTDLSAVGDLVEAGLPNITGNWEPQIHAAKTVAFTRYARGAIKISDEANTANGATLASGGTTLAGDGFDIDASLSSPYYRDDIQKPTPQTIKSLLYICVATSVKTPVAVDIDEIATDLNNKADKDFANVTDVAKGVMASMAMPSARFANLSFVNNSSLTSPSDGYFYLQGRTSAAAQYMELSNNTSGIKSFTGAPYTGWGIEVWIPAKKGDVVSTNTNTPITEFKFVYAEGAN